MSGIICTIPASYPFARKLTEGIMETYADKAHALPELLILLPTRRACRVLQEEFLALNAGQPTLLPRMRPIADVDEDFLSLLQGSDGVWDIPPALSPFKRQIILAGLIKAMPLYDKGMAQNLSLARTLGALMDEIYTENLDLADLPKLVDVELLADHWGITVRFLDILATHWQDYLKAQNKIDLADRRNRLLKALNKFWQENPPQTPIIAAGTTGTIPATATLLETILTCPKGQVILPGLDKSIPNQDSEKIEEGHPQATLKNLLNALGKSREDVTYYKNCTPQAKDRFFSTLFAPSQSVERLWEYEPAEKEISEALAGLTRIDCNTEEEEAQIIALALRETLEAPDKTAALITPDRQLAQRVRTICTRWGLSLDDSAGQTLDKTAHGRLMLKSLSVLEKDFRPVPFLSFLQHPFITGESIAHYRKNIRIFNLTLARIPSNGQGLARYTQAFQSAQADPFIQPKPPEAMLKFLNKLEQILTPLLSIQSKILPVADFMQAHLDSLERLTMDDDGQSLLWKGEVGQTLADHIAQFLQQTDDMPPIPFDSYQALLKESLSSQILRPRYGTHPRLHILGQMEARLIKADRIILGGMNEGVWPPAPAVDPWMSRPMRAQYGLPLPERALSLAAHDFQQAIAQRDVIVTRARKRDNAPTVPARWLQRLEAYCEKHNLGRNFSSEFDSSQAAFYKNCLAALTKSSSLPPLSRPAPCPPLSSRPDQLSVTQIERWRTDPYQIYAQKILSLYPLNALEAPADNRMKGQLVHTILKTFTDQYPDKLPENPLEAFLKIAREEAEKLPELASDLPFFMPRLIRMGEWFLEQESKWREGARVLATEAEGYIQFDDPAITKRPFTLKARVDRLDLLSNGSLALIDYKTGGEYKKSDILNGTSCQIPLEALILNGNGFAAHAITNKKTGAMTYWKITGGRQKGEEILINDSDNIDDLLQRTHDGLTHLIKQFEDPNTPYYAVPDPANSPRFNDYAHLERIKEWSVLGDSEGNDTGEAA